jgi:aspartate kinase
MKIFKFGGASVKNTEGIKNVASILQTYKNEKLLVVISAMDKTTNLLEKLVEAYYTGSPETKDILQQVKNYHFGIIQELQSGLTFPVIHEIENIFLELECIIETPVQQEDYDFIYDQIVPFGELISTRIVSNYLLSLNIQNQWLDSRNFILTDDRYRDARIQWIETENIIKKRLSPLAEKNLVITQGFIGRGPHNETTTLGREGSDYSAAIFAYCLGAESVSIWKDVAGVMNADPKKFSDAVLIPELDYTDAIELAYYGASVIHPKTIQPLKAKSIPLHVRSFIDVNATGTTVSNRSKSLELPCFILKENQVLIQLSTKDFTFIVEENLQKIFSILAQFKVRSNIIQNSAISFSFVADIHQERTHKLLNEFSGMEFNVNMKGNLQLLTIYNAREYDVKEKTQGKKIILEQLNGKTVHYLTD